MSRTSYSDHLALVERADANAWTIGKHWAKPAPVRAQPRQRRADARSMSSRRAMFKAGK